MPDIHVSDESREAVISSDASDLGYYEDGTRRTLTDDQIAMFRHSEIQRLLTARRHRQLAEEEEAKTRKQKREEAKDTRASRYETPTRFDNDSTVHDRSHVNELSYDENTTKPKEKTFLWPVLGA